MLTQKSASTALYFFSFILLGMVHASLGPTLPYLQDNTSSTIKAISILLTMRSLGYLIASLGGGRLYDKVRGHLLLFFTLLALSLVLSAVPFIQLLWPLALLMIVVGFAEGMLDVGTNTLVVWTHKDNLGPFMNALHLFFGIGAFGIPLVVAFFNSSGNIAWTYWFLAALISPIAFIYLFLPSPTAIKEAHEETNPEIKAPTISKNILIALIAFFFFIYVGVEIGFGNWLSTYVIQLGIGTEQMGAYLTSGFWGAFMIGRLITIPAAVKLKPQQLLWISLITTLISISFLLFQGSMLTGLWIGTILLGLSIAAVFPTLLAFADNHMQMTGRITGLFFTGVSLGAMTLPWIIGQFLENTGPHVLLFAVLICAIALIALMVIISLHINRRKTIKA